MTHKPPTEAVFFWGIAMNEDQQERATEEWRRIKPKDFARSEDLQCRWGAWSVIDYGELRLDMGHDNCCDMTGAIKVATMLMPEVRRVVTFAGGKRDTEYRLTRTGWTAYLPPVPGYSLYDVGTKRRSP